MNINTGSKVAALCTLLAALATPAQATEVDKAFGLYILVHYESKCEPGSLSKDAQQVLTVWLASMPTDVKLAALLKLSEAQAKSDPASVCAKLKSPVKTHLDSINADAKTIMRAARYR